MQKRGKTWKYTSKQKNVPHQTNYRHETSFKKHDMISVPAYLCVSACRPLQWLLQQCGGTVQRFNSSHSRPRCSSPLLAWFHLHRRLHDRRLHIQFGPH